MSEEMKVFAVLAQMATYNELVVLREEERVLMKIASKLNDQLNRLKVLYFVFSKWLHLRRRKGK